MVEVSSNSCHTLAVKCFKREIWFLCWPKQNIVYSSLKRERISDFSWIPKSNRDTWSHDPLLLFRRRSLSRSQFRMQARITPLLRRAVVGAAVGVSGNSFRSSCAHSAAADKEGSSAVLQSMRKDYSVDHLLDEKLVEASPFALFRKWFGEVRYSQYC